MIVQL